MGPRQAAACAPKLAAVVARRSRRRYRLTVTIIDWNGTDVPEALRNLPAGRYAMEPVDETFELSADEDEGLVNALQSLREGRGVPHDLARALLRRDDAP